MSKVPSTRWSATPEQLLVLEKLYRSGIKTPNAVQIQQITAFLSPYGSIEAKNVFYWFQNHKARERKRMKKWLSSQQQLLLQQPYQPSNCSNPPHVAPTHQFPVMEIPFPPPLPPPFQLLHPYILPQMVHHEGNPAIKLASKVETCEEEMGKRTMNPPPVFDEGSFAKTEVGGPVTAGSRPLVTLELFPTKSTGLKDELISPSTSKSTSCSTFT